MAKPRSAFPVLATLVASGLLNACSAQNIAPASSESPTTHTTVIAQENDASGSLSGSRVLATLPKGAEGDLIAYGRNIIRNTPQLAGKYITAGMSCEACHVNAGTKAHAGSLMGIYALFPQYNRRAKHFITLQDRLAECFLYSMNGTPPSYSSREMIALTAYISFLSRGATIGRGYPSQGYTYFKPRAAPNVGLGARVYVQQCAACHGASGAGSAVYPPLWGPKSFNDRAGMHRLTTMSAFVKYNMPFGQPPNRLSEQNAYDVSAFILSHPRPKFDGTRLISFPAQQAKTF